MADREYIPFYRSFYEQISACDDPKARLEMYEVLLDYAFNKNEPDFDKVKYNGYTYFFWLGARPILRKSWAQYENGCKGGAPKGNTNNKGKRKVNPKLTQSQANKDIDNDNEKDIDNDNDNDNESESEKGKLVTRAPAFIPPTLEEVLNYYNFNHGNYGDESVAKKFYTYYSARGWKMAQTPMNDWKAALDTWIEREPRFASDPRQAEREKLARDYASRMALRMAQDDQAARNPLANYPSFNNAGTNLIEEGARAIAALQAEARDPKEPLW